jgi:hypothetical protein
MCLFALLISGLISVDKFACHTRSKTSHYVLIPLLADQYGRYLASQPLVHPMDCQKLL